jgi:hypothetical protein
MSESRASYDVFACHIKNMEMARFMATSSQKLSLLQQNIDTAPSHVISHRTTAAAQPRLTSVIGRERVLSRWYDRCMTQCVICFVYDHNMQDFFPSFFARL